MREFLELGSAPFDEDCAQVGAPDYGDRSRAECRALVNQLNRQRPLPPRAEYVIKVSPHDFGSYREVGVRYDTNDGDAVAAAFEAEETFPARWDAEARAELAAAGFPVKDF